jgi:hypothetical protein
MPRVPDDGLRRRYLFRDKRRTSPLARRDSVTVGGSQFSGGTCCTKTSGGWYEYGWRGYYGWCVHQLPGGSVTGHRGIRVMACRPRLQTSRWAWFLRVQCRLGGNKPDGGLGAVLRVSACTWLGVPFAVVVMVERDFICPRDQWVKADISASIWSAKLWFPLPV